MQASTGDRGRIVRVAAARASFALLALLAVGAARAGAQEYCTCSDASFVWRGCDAEGRCDPGAWSGCSPSPDDGFSIENGCEVVVDRADVLFTHVAPRRLRVQTGGSLTVRGPAELRIGPIGLEAAPGSRVDLSGCYRRYTGSGPDCADLLDASAIFPIGRVIPCRDGACGDDAQIVRLDWSAAAPDLAASIDAFLQRLDASRDVLCFWQSSMTAVGADSGYCYKVSDVGAGEGARYLDFDVRQVWSTQSDQAGYPLWRRLVQTGTLATDAPVGARTLRFAEGALVEGRVAPIGRFVRCAGDQRSYLVAGASDDPQGDALVLADRRGLDSAYAAGTTCHVDWGWAEGDMAFVMAPVHVTPHTANPGESQLLLKGDTTLRAVVADGLGGQVNTPTSNSIQIIGGPLRALEDVWVTDPLVEDGAAVLLDDLPCGSSVRHLVVTGGPGEPERDKNYGLGWWGGAACSYTLEHLYTRFAGDDSFLLESSGADPVGSISIRWVQGGPSSSPGDSGQLFDFGNPNPTTVWVRDALCTSCTSDDGYGALVAASAGPGLVENVLWVGTHGGGLQAAPEDANDETFGFQRFGVVGGNADPAVTTRGGALAGLNADRFYVRDVEDARPDGDRLCMGSQYNARTRWLSRGVFLGVTLGAVPCEVARAELSDLYFLDVTRAGTPGELISVPRWASDVRLARITTAFTAPAAGAAFGVLAPYFEAAPALTLDGLLLTGFRGPDAVRAMSLGQVYNAQNAHWGAPTCFYDNVEDEEPPVLAAYGVPPVQGVDPAFAYPPALRFDLAAQSPLLPVECGARDAGYEELDWAHRKAKLQPVFIGRHKRQCGLGAEVAPAIAVLARRLARSRRALRS